MKHITNRIVRVGTVGVCMAVMAGQGWANGGPFVVKYPDGDPAAKGVLARLDPSLKPARESRLEVVSEDLDITFGTGYRHDRGRQQPLVHVQAAYRIRNPRDETIEMDFGFPILRGIYMEPLSMMPRPSVTVMVDKKSVPAKIISNSAIYGIIRQQCRQVIDQAINDDATLAKLAKRIRNAKGVKLDSAKQALVVYLAGELKWGERDARLLGEYLSIDIGKAPVAPVHIAWHMHRDHELSRLVQENLGVLSAIGEKKATQLFAQLAGRFDPGTGSGYEEIFKAWGGDVRERSIDLESGKIRPREITHEREQPDTPRSIVGGGLTTYARVEYLDEDAKLSDAEKDACRAILKNLPVIFTYAPMNLLYYRVAFEPGAELTVTVRYSQYAYEDSHKPKSYQLAYVVHPASLWDRFGPITLTVSAPKGVAVRSSVPCEQVQVNAVKRVLASSWSVVGKQLPMQAHRGTITDKTGELLVAVSAEEWTLALQGKEKDLKTSRKR